jgi:hypothetical protein
MAATADCRRVPEDKWSGTEVLSIFLARPALRVDGGVLSEFFLRAEIDVPLLLLVLLSSMEWLRRRLEEAPMPELSSIMVLFVPCDLLPDVPVSLLSSNEEGRTRLSRRLRLEEESMGRPVSLSPQ